MELEQFIKQTLLGIRGGLKSANKVILGDKYGVDASPFVLEPSTYNRDKKENGFVTFDIAVTVSEETKGTGGAEIKIYVASLGGKTEGISTERHVSKIAFSVAISEMIS